MNKIKQWLNTRFGFFTLAVVLFWAKSYITYFTSFSMSVSGWFQHFILLINPIGMTILIFSIALYVKKPGQAYGVLMVSYFLASVLLYANVLYYREFSDFLSVSTIFRARNFSGSIGPSTFVLVHVTDCLFWFDFMFFLYLLFSRRGSIKIDNRFFKRSYAALITLTGLLILAGNVVLAEYDRPQLLERTFDRHYIVKYLGINSFTVYDGLQTIEAYQNRANADESDIKNVLSYVDEHETEPNSEYFGIAEGRNVIYIHLESIQQFLIDYQMEDEDGELHEVTPFLNSLFHDPATHSFSNYFHQVGQGKSADAEMLVENSLFGFPQGGAFSQIGSTNTFQSGAQILRSEAGYTSAVFHGNTGSFWNRSDTYKSMGIDYFFDSEYYTMTEENTFDYGMKDKLFFRESVQYLEQLQQPFYSKFITVTNHFPYPLEEENASIPPAATEDETINQYFVTSRYADEAIEEFFLYLKESGLYEQSIFVLYGDHFGVSNSRNETLAPLLGEDPLTWDAYDNAMMQRVPLMIHIPGTENGGIHDEMAGMVDTLPTLLHLLGVETDDYMLMGTDLLSEDHDQIVTFRNGDFVTPQYTMVGPEIYYTDSGELIDEPSEAILAEVERIKQMADTQLSTSDKILTSDLLRFYTPEGWIKTNPEDFSYTNQVRRMRKLSNALGSESKSLLDLNNDESTVELYKTDAPELREDAE